MPKTESRPTATANSSGEVRVEGISKMYGNHKVLDDVSFRVPAGSVCTLLGASGSGKTTTLRMIAGLDRPDTGEIWIDGELMASAKTVVPAERRDIGLVFQAYALWPHMRVYDQIAYPLRVRGLRRAAVKQAVDAAAALVDMGEFTDRYPSELSGGQQQRVALARALVFGPRVLLLDEPMSGLDAALRRRTRHELQELQRRLQVTTIYVTHDQEEAMAVSDHVVVLSEGRVVSTAAPRQIYERPRSIYEASFIGASNLLDGEVVEVSAETVTIRTPHGDIVAGTGQDSFATGDRATLAIKPEDVTVHAEPRSGPGFLGGHVVSATYLGAHVELLLDVSGWEFRVPVERSTAVAAGDDVHLYLPEQHVTILHPDKPGAP